MKAKAVMTAGILVSAISGCLMKFRRGGAGGCRNHISDRFCLGIIFIPDMRDRG